MENKTLKSKLVRYMDAGFPVIYINTFEEDKVDTIINEIHGGKEVYEWNETNGYIDFETKTPMIEDCTLEMMLDQFKMQEMLDRKIILLKDINVYLDDARIVSKLKGLAKMISQGADAIVIIVSNILIIPKELEKFITILEMDYLNSEEIQEIVLNFIQDTRADVIGVNLVEELAVAKMELCLVWIIAIIRQRIWPCLLGKMQLLWDCKQQLSQQGYI
ncbi:MAG: hypothetical protein R3Y24_01190 [Eubacteriales bacterium]